MKNQNHPETQSTEQTLIHCEKETWRLIQERDLDGFASHLAAEFYDIFPDGTERTKAELLAFLSTAELKEFQLSHFRVTPLNQDSAIVTYRADARALIQGKEVSLKENVTAGWARRDGRWLNVCALGSPSRNA